MQKKHIPVFYCCTLKSVQKSVPGLYNEDNLFNDTIKNLHYAYGQQKLVIPNCKTNKTFS